MSSGVSRWRPLPRWLPADHHLEHHARLSGQVWGPMGDAPDWCSTRSGSLHSWGLSA